MGSNSVSKPNFVKIAQTAAKIYQFFDFSKMTAAAILDFGIYKFLTVGTVKKVELHHRVKFRQNRSNCG